MTAPMDVLATIIMVITQLGASVGHFSGIAPSQQGNQYRPPSFLFLDKEWGGGREGGKGGEPVYIVAMLFPLSPYMAHTCGKVWEV